MDEDEIVFSYEVSPKLHNKWSLLALAAGFIGDIARVVADNTSTAATMAIQHAKQKEFDKEFAGITMGVELE